MASDVPLAWRQAADVVLLLHSAVKETSELIMVKHPSGTAGSITLTRIPALWLFNDVKRQV